MALQQIDHASQHNYGDFWGELKQSEWKEFEVITEENVIEHRSAVPTKECITVVILFG